MAVDYKNTVFLPRTDFPMRAGLPAKEPQILEHWRKLDLYRALRQQSKGREPFVLHDGPPYANGNIHIGHAENKILKDVVTRTQQMLGKDSNYVPGWDCHGLPIEWKIEEKYRAAGKDKDTVPVLEFREECRQFAEHWVRVQSEEFQRLGVIGDWPNPYLTMTKGAEAQIAREIHKFLLNGGLYQGVKPVLWSVVEKTALADAEVEYHDHKSPTIWVRFPVLRTAIPELADGAVLIWTTTPWTIPGNRGLAYGPEFEYAVYTVEALGENSYAKVGEKLLIATALAEAVREKAKIASWAQSRPFRGEEIAGTVCAHPLRGFGGQDIYGFEVPALPADFVTTEAGTGIVHIAPNAGADDFVLGQQHGLEVAHTVAADGRYYDRVPLFAGRSVYTSEGKTGDANDAVIGALRDAGALLTRGTLLHSYPHSWRSKAPLIFRTTPQWFISMETNDLRQKALEAIEATRWVPAQSKNRIRAMIETRPDWTVSRQRSWGVPLAFFVKKGSGQPLKDEAVLNRIAEIFEAEGSDAWFARDPQDFLGNAYDAADYDQVRDIVEVWFESGSTHAFVLEQRPDLKWPASLYLEGSDQHRGWFHSSLLESCGTRGRAPYDAVLTHGFALDEDGRKMSKSLGNGVEPQDVIKQNGADVLRLWVVNSDYAEDIRIGADILKHQVELYRRLRNTLRYLLGALDGFSETERLGPAELAKMPELERWALHRLWELDRLVRQCVENFEFNRMFTALHTFCTVDLSAFYFDVRKDSLYCDRPDSLRRRAVRTVMDEIFSRLTAWLAPILCFTAEEAWLAYRKDGDPESVHLRTYPATPADWQDDALAAKWERIRDIRRVVTGALELARAEKRIGSSLQASPVVHVADTEALRLVRSVDFAEVAITSDLSVSDGEAPVGAFTLPDVPGVAVVSGLADGAKCDRCWRVLPEVGSNPLHEPLCVRCAEAVDSMASAAE